jgi:hypothetical protein
MSCRILPQNELHARMICRCTIISLHECIKLMLSHAVRFSTHPQRRLMHECNALRFSFAIMLRGDTTYVSSILITEYMVKTAQAGL